MDTDRIATPDATTRRTTGNAEYRLRALQILQAAEHDGEYRWLFDAEALRKGVAHAWRPTVLAELGRIADPGSMCAIARQICAPPPKTAAEAVRLIRRWRAGATPGAVEEIADELKRQLDSYRVHHPDTSSAAVLAALDIVYEYVEAVSRAEQQPLDDASGG